jgi:glycosyltransferase involved in cell wall biosynthesis
MRVLVVHNRYRSALPSGENLTVDAEVQGLRESVRGIDVDCFFRESDEVQSMHLRSRVGAAMAPLLGDHGEGSLARRLDTFQPDVVHLHNPYPLISPLAIKESADRGIPVVATIHNFRLRCINGLFFRDGAVCTECEFKRVPIPGFVHACYRESRVQSSVLATALTIHRPLWSRVARYIAVSPFVADRLRGWGVHEDRISIKANPVVDPGPLCEPGDGFLFAGRLSEEKGIELLLDAWELSGLDGSARLLIVGDGPLRSLVETRAKSSRSVTFLGQLSPARTAELRRETAVGVVSSICFESHSAVGESFAQGRPVVTTNLGALSSAVDETVGWVSAPEARHLAACLRAAHEPGAVAALSQPARARYELLYRSDLLTDQLIDIYQLAQEKWPA